MSDDLPVKVNNNKDPIREKLNVLSTEHNYL